MSHNHYVPKQAHSSVKVQSVTNCCNFSKLHMHTVNLSIYCTDLVGEVCSVPATNNR